MSTAYTATSRGLPLGRRRGFTLIELVVVVSIIAVFATLAIPTVVSQLRDRRVQEAARTVALVYRQARLRAMGRGSAVLVRFADGAFTVHEARLGVGGDCGDLPVASCTNTTWVTGTGQRLVDGYGVSSAGEMSNMTLAIVDAASAAVPALEVCFTPLGRALVRTAVDDDIPFAALDEAYLVSASRPGAGRTRSVVLMPNGSARLTE
jgi:type IV fimbrial biogenesis protein FimT